AGREAEKQQPTAHELSCRGEPSLKSRVRDAELGEITSDLLEVLELAPSRLEEDQPHGQAGDGRRQPPERGSDSFRERPDGRDQGRAPIHDAPFVPARSRRAEPLSFWMALRGSVTTAAAASEADASSCEPARASQGTPCRAARIARTSSSGML